MIKGFKDYISEALTSSQRYQRSRMMKRKALRMAFKRKIASKKTATYEQLEKRAGTKARMLIRKKLLQGKKYNDLSIAEKMAIDKRVENKTIIIQKLTKKLIPVVKKMEEDRLAKAKENS